MGKISVIVIGAGSRGMGYSRTAELLKEEYEIVAVAEPVECRRNYIKELFHLPDDRCFTDWREILALPKMADAAFICTMDRDHCAPTLKAIELGYEIMLEKPIAPTPEECALITKAADEKGVNVLICHVLRFTPFYGRLKQLIMDGYVGDVQVVQQIEKVGMLHQSHSFVRGNWGNSERSSCMLLQKSCHDIDIIQWLLDKKCERVSSFGGLRYFTEENAPAGAPERCLDGGCPIADTCPFHTDKLYLHPPVGSGYASWFRNSATKMIKSTDEAVLEALKTTNYGKCVYRCDNDVVDRQVVNMEFEGGVVASFTMTAFTGGLGGRFIRVMGTKGAITARMGDETVTYDDFITGKTTQIPVVGGTGETSIVGGHGGGDLGIMGVFGKLVANEYDGVAAATISVSCDNHMIVFAAEEARKEGTVVSVPEFAARYGI